MEWLRDKFESSRGGSAHNVLSMEGLRGFAVFLVFLVHYVTLVGPWLDASPVFVSFVNSVRVIGNSGVDLFFVLSGYLIYGSLIARPQPFLRFMSRRVERIYPAFVAVFAIYVAMSFALPSESKIPGQPLVAAGYLVANFLLLPGLFPIEPLITVAWSLSYEMFYYLTIPLVIVLFRLRGRGPAWRAAFFACIAVALVSYCAARGGHVRLVMFIAGILLHEALRSTAVPAPPSAAALLTLVVGLLGMLLPFSGSAAFALKTTGLFVAFFVLCFTCFRLPVAWLPRVFTWTPLRWLGNMSYSYYLLHGLTLKAEFLALSHVLPARGYGAWFFWVLLPAAFVLTLLPTAGLFLAIERPLSLAPRRGRRGAAAAPVGNASN